MTDDTASGFGQWPEIVRGVGGALRRRKHRRYPVVAALVVMKLVMA